MTSVTNNGNINGPYVWSHGFIADRAFEGSPLKILRVLDEYCRDCLEIEGGTISVLL
jgi:hypothetical protein